MLSKTDVQALIDSVFEDQALLIGGMAAVGEVDDDLVWRLIRNLDLIRGKALRRLDAGVPDGPGLTPHPAIEQFLETVRAT